MLYKVSELAAILDVPDRTLRAWLKNGAPHSRDTRKHIWINGTDFARWVDNNQKKKRRKKMTNGEAYCFRCKLPVKLINPKVIPIKGKLINIRGNCPNCESVINRGGRID